MADTQPGLYPYRPDHAVHPGELIAEARREAGMKQSHLAGACRVSPKHMNQIENGVKPLHAHLAVEIEVALGLPIAETLMRMQASYDVFHERQKFRERLAGQAALLAALPTPSLEDQKHG